MIALTIPEFPRIKHLVPWSNATRDDLIEDPQVLKNLLADAPICVVQEKIDGANLAFTAENGTIVARNRNHMLSGCTRGPGDFQFNSLYNWFSSDPERYARLCDFCEQGYAIHGEWVKVIHSVEYNSLPDWFVGFDICHIKTGIFWTDPILVAQTLSIMGLAYVPSITIEPFTKSLLDKIEWWINPESNTTSEFDENSQIEGVMIRPTSGQYEGERFKIVRSGFIAGDHWSKTQPKYNKLA